jgi:hypothetical protein
MATIRGNPDHDYLPGTATLVDHAFTSVTKAVPGKGELSFVRSDGETFVRGNTDDDPTPNFEIELRRADLRLLASDFIGVF